MTTTVTEAGYVRGASGIDHEDPHVARDVALLRANPRAPVQTAPAKIVAFLLARRAAGGGGLTVVPCDNLPANGEVLRGVVDDLASLVDPSLQAWADEHVSYVTTMVDRITPASTDADVARARAAGFDDAAPVATEPFAEWVLAGEFRGPRPAWETAGATFTDDVVPYEERKLFLLNGVRILPTLRRERAAGRMPDGAVAALAAWVASVRAGGPALSDPLVGRLRPLIGAPTGAASRELLALMDPALVDDVELVAAVVHAQVLVVR